MQYHRVHVLKYFNILSNQTTFFSCQPSQAWTINRNSLFSFVQVFETWRRPPIWCRLALLPWWEYRQTITSSYVRIIKSAVIIKSALIFSLFNFYYSGESLARSQLFIFLVTLLQVFINFLILPVIVSFSQSPRPNYCINSIQFNSICDRLQGQRG